MPDPEAKPENNCEELHGILDQELAALADKYRLPIVLCDLEGRTRRDVARQLKIPDGTLSNRLATARKLLARSLLRHGVTLSAGAVASVLAQQAASASVPASLAGTTIKAATAIAAGNGAVTAAVSANVAVLTKGVMQAMFLTKLKAFASVLVVAAMIGVAVLTSGRLVFGQTDDKADETGNLVARADEEPERPGAVVQPPEGGAAEDERDWRGEFQKLDGLADGEVLKAHGPSLPGMSRKGVR